MRGFWGDLGTRWRIREQYFKAYPVCRWAQPAVEAALALQRAHRFAADDIVALSIESFREAIALGLGVRDGDDDRRSAIQPAVTRSRRRWCSATSAPPRSSAPKLADPRVARLQRAMTLTEDAEFSRRFPAERWARVRITLADGRTLVSEPARARGNPENPLADDELTRRSIRATPSRCSARRARRESSTPCDRLPTDRAALPALLDDILRSHSRR